MTILTCLRELQDRGAKKYPAIVTIHVRRCALADRHHRKSLRAYMHVNHVADPLVICYAAATSKLPRKNILGLLAHEIGHIMSGAASQAVADDTALFLFGVPVLYDDRRVEYMEVP